MAERYEKFWNEHCDEIGLAEKLHLAQVERMVGGESFLMFHPNRAMQTVPVSLTVYEAEQIQAPTGWPTEQQENAEYGPVDGLHFDRYGNVIAFEKLRKHPGGNYSALGSELSDTISAQIMIQFFRQDRPSQFRGVPEVAPTLEIYANLRRFIESKVSQEELRAKLLGAVRTGFNPEQCADLGDDPIEMAIGSGQFLTLLIFPEWKCGSMEVTVE